MPEHAERLDPGEPFGNAEAVEEILDALVLGVAMSGFVGGESTESGRFDLYRPGHRRDDLVDAGRVEGSKKLLGLVCALGGPPCLVDAPQVSVHCRCLW